MDKKVNDCLKTKKKNGYDFNSCLLQILLFDYIG